MVRTIHTTGIINKIRIAGATLQTVFDTTALSHTQITAFTKYFAAQLFAINAQTVIGLITHLGMGFSRCFDISAYAAIPN